jgi:uncharacterized protein (DUF4213/DUF364 family)
MRDLLPLSPPGTGVGEAIATWIGAADRRGEGKIMNICERLCQAIQARAANVRVETVSIGLGYTAVGTSDGGIGLAYTPLDEKQGCSVVAADVDFENGPALDLLEQLHSSRPVHRAVALALVNALNHRAALGLPEDRSNETLLDLLGIRQGTRVAMAGYFGPLMGKLAKHGAVVEVADTGQGIGDQKEFHDKLAHWAEALIMTSTAILNQTADALLAAAGPQVRTALLGPSTPLLGEAFEGLPVRVLAGTVPLDREATFKAIRHGKGTPALIRFARKAYLAID